MRISDWSSDVCSSDLADAVRAPDAGALDPLGGRTEDQADAAFREGIAERGHPARHPAVPLRPRDPTRIAPQDRPVLQSARILRDPGTRRRNRVRRRSEEHTAERQSLMRTSYAVFC